MKKTGILLLCLLLCFMACQKRAPEAVSEPTAAPQETPEAAEEPTAAPEQDAFNADMVFSGTTFDGEPIDNTVFQDYDLIIINIWAEWCGPCVGELPAIEQIHQEYPNVLILGVWVGDDKDGAKATLADAGVTYPALEPAGGLTALSMRSMYIPATYFFDKNGNEVGEQVVGSMQYDQWKATVENLLG